MRYITCLVIFLLGLSSCKRELDGDCSKPFKFEISRVSNQNGDANYDIKVNKNENWWISDISVQGVSQLENSSRYAPLDAFVIDNDGFRLEKVNNRLIKFTFKHSDNLSLKKYDIQLQSGNCFGGFELY